MSSSNTKGVWKWVRPLIFTAISFASTYLYLTSISTNGTFSCSITPEYGISIPTIYLCILVFCIGWTLGLFIYQLINKWSDKIGNFMQIMLLAPLCFIFFVIDDPYSLGLAILSSTYLLYCIYRTIKNYRITKNYKLSTKT